MSKPRKRCPHGRRRACPECDAEQVFFNRQLEQMAYGESPLARLSPQSRLHYYTHRLYQTLSPEDIRDISQELDRMDAQIYEGVFAALTRTVPRTPDERAHGIADVHRARASSADRDTLSLDWRITLRSAERLESRPLTQPPNRHHRRRLRQIYASILDVAWDMLSNDRPLDATATLTQYVPLHIAHRLTAADTMCRTCRVPLSPETRAVRVRRTLDDAHYCLSCVPANPAPDTRHRHDAYDVIQRDLRADHVSVTPDGGLSVGYSVRYLATPTRDSVRAVLRQTPGVRHVDLYEDFHIDGVAVTLYVDPHPRRPRHANESHHQHHAHDVLHHALPAGVSATVSVVEIDE